MGTAAVFTLAALGRRIAECKPHAASNERQGRSPAIPVAAELESGRDLGEREARMMAERIAGQDISGMAAGSAAFEDQSGHGFCKVDLAGLGPPRRSAKGPSDDGIHLVVRHGRVSYLSAPVDREWEAASVRRSGMGELHIARGIPWVSDRRSTANGIVQMGKDGLSIAYCDCCAKYESVL
jgi:hypothetical protein